MLPRQLLPPEGPLSLTLFNVFKHCVSMIKDKYAADADSAKTLLKKTSRKKITRLENFIFYLKLVGQGLD